LITELPSWETHDETSLQPRASQKTARHQKTSPFKTQSG
jgi:hypothetical protein